MTVYSLVTKFVGGEDVSFSVKRDKEWLTVSRSLKDIIDLFGNEEVKDAKFDIGFCFGNNWVDIEIEI